jgi:hypothetical protein
MKTLLVAAAVLAATSTLASAQQTRFDDSRGNSVGTATTSNGVTTFRDSRGNTTGTATSSGNTRTFRDNRGSVTGRSYR